jgi:pimeloyl-ACP methyl ester carboxylesterase
MAMDHEEFNGHGSTVRVRAGDVHYVDVGEGPCALFVHGVFTSCHLWRNLISELARERRCIALDLPGHGRTRVGADQALDLPGQAELLEEFCEALSLGDVDLVANDTGGAIAQVYAARHADRLRTLTLTNCDVQDQIPPDAFKPVADVARAGELAPALKRLASDVELARKSFTQTYEHPERVPEATIREYSAPLADERCALQVERTIASLDAADLYAVESALAKFDVPTLIVWGTGDVFFDVKWAYWLRDAIGGADEVVEIDGGRLFHPEERAGDIAPHVLAHWRAHA